MILFDELGLAEKSPANPLKVLHYRLECEKENKDKNKLEYDDKNKGYVLLV